MPNQQKTQIILNNEEIANRYPEMLAAVWKRCMHFAGCTLNITPIERDQHGWLEWCLQVTFTSGSQLFIGAIQRMPGGSIEFHT